MITKATLGRATHVGEDQTPVFAYDGEAYVAVLPDLGGGKWDLRLEAQAEDGTMFRRRFEMEREG